MTWLADFHAQTELNKYPIALRTRGGIGYMRPDGLIESNFVGHAIHYFDAGEWRPITLAYLDGQWEGSDFAWNGYAVMHKKKILFQPNSIIFNGIVYPLNFFLDAANCRVVAYIPNIGEYVIQFTEDGVKEILTIPEPLDGVLEFDVKHKRSDLQKTERRIMNIREHVTGDVFTLTPDMTYPLVIDPDYSTSTYYQSQGGNAVIATARSTCTWSNAGYFKVGQELGYTINRGAIKFNTSGIPNGATISQVNMALSILIDLTVTDFTLSIKKCDWSAYDPISFANDTVYDLIKSSVADANWRSTAGMATSTYYQSSALDVTRISDTGYTYFGLISSRDAASNTPTNDEMLEGFAAAPYLTVAHTGGGSGSSARNKSLLGVGL